MFITVISDINDFYKTKVIVKRKMEKSNGHHVPRTSKIPTIIITDYDAELASQQRQVKEKANHQHQVKQETNETNAANYGSKSQSNDSEEEDREIIEALTKAHSSNCERHVDDMICSSSVDQSGLAEKIQLELQTDDDMADQEVSKLTSLLESKKKFAPVPDTILNLQRPAASFAAVPPPGTLPDISDVAVPQIVPKKKELIATDSFDIETPNFQPLGEMSFSVSESRFNRSECVPANILKNRRTVRLFGESESDSQCSSTSSSDEQPPLYWKLYNNGSSENPEAGSTEDDISQILNSYHVVEDIVDDNVPSTSNNLAKESNI